LEKPIDKGLTTEVDSSSQKDDDENKSEEEDQNDDEEEEDDADPLVGQICFLKIFKYIIGNF